MAAAVRVVFVGPGENPCLKSENILLPNLKQGEILGAIIAATICGSDLHTISGKRMEPTPGILGHEGVIKVIEHRRPEYDLNPGDRLTFHIADCCNNCQRCHDGVEQKCLSLFKYGHALASDGSGLNGCYATHILLRPGTHVVKLPESISSLIAAPLNCAFATMVNVVSKVTLSQEVLKQGNSRRRVALIQGAGLLGIYGCVLLKERGFDEVFCSDINRDRLLMVAKFGGLPLDAGNPQDNLQDDSVDAVIEVCGSAGVISEGVRVLRPGGTYVIAGMVHPNSVLHITGEQMIRKCLTITGVHNYAPRHLDRAVELLSKTIDKYPYQELLSEPFSLQDIDKAIALANEQKYFRVLLTPNYCK